MTELLSAHWFPGLPVPEDDDGYMKRLAEIEWIEKHYFDRLAAAVNRGLAGNQ